MFQSKNDVMFFISSYDPHFSKYNSVETKLFTSYLNEYSNNSFKTIL